MSEGSFVGDDNIDWGFHWRVEQKGENDFGGQDPSKVFGYALSYLPKKPFRVLELGCGIAKWSPLWTALGAIYAGLDGSKDALEEARRRYPNLTFFLENAHNLVYFANFCGTMDFPPQDIIFSHAFIQHTNIDTKRKIFSALGYYRTILGDKGILVLQENTQDGNTKTTFTLQGWIDFIEPFGFKCVCTPSESPDTPSHGGMVFVRR